MLPKRRSEDDKKTLKIRTAMSKEVWKAGKHALKHDRALIKIEKLEKEFEAELAKQRNQAKLANQL